MDKQSAQIVFNKLKTESASYLAGLLLKSKEEIIRDSEFTGFVLRVQMFVNESENMGLLRHGCRLGVSEYELTLELVYDYYNAESGDLDYTTEYGMSEVISWACVGNED